MVILSESSVAQEVLSVVGARNEVVIPHPDGDSPDGDYRAVLQQNISSTQDADNAHFADSSFRASCTSQGNTSTFSYSFYDSLAAPIEVFAPAPILAERENKFTSFQEFEIFEEEDAVIDGGDDDDPDLSGLFNRLQAASRLSQVFEDAFLQAPETPLSSSPPPLSPPSSEFAKSIFSQTTTHRQESQIAENASPSVGNDTLYDAADSSISIVVAKESPLSKAFFNRFREKAAMHGISTSTPSAIESGTKADQVSGSPSSSASVAQSANCQGSFVSFPSDAGESPATQATTADNVDTDLFANSSGVLGMDSNTSSGAALSKISNISNQAAPIPAFTGPESLPYCRNPSGVEGSVVDSLGRIINMWIPYKSDPENEYKEIIFRRPGQPPVCNTVTGQERVQIPIERFVIKIEGCDYKRVPSWAHDPSSLPRGNLPLHHFSPARGWSLRPRPLDPTRAAFAPSYPPSFSAPPLSSFASAHPPRGFDEMIPSFPQASQANRLSPKPSFSRPAVPHSLPATDFLLLFSNMLSTPMLPTSQLHQQPMFSNDMSAYPQHAPHPAGSPINSPTPDPMSRLLRINALLEELVALGSPDPNCEHGINSTTVMTNMINQKSSERAEALRRDEQLQKQQQEHLLQTLRESKQSQPNIIPHSAHSPAFQEQSMSTYLPAFLRSDSSWNREEDQILMQESQRLNPSFEPFSPVVTPAGDITSTNPSIVVQPPPPEASTGQARRNRYPNLQLAPLPPSTSYIPSSPRTISSPYPYDSVVSTPEEVEDVALSVAVAGRRAVSMVVHPTFTTKTSSSISSPSEQNSFNHASLSGEKNNISSMEGDANRIIDNIGVSRQINLKAGEGKGFLNGGRRRAGLRANAPTFFATSPHPASNEFGPLKKESSAEPIELEDGNQEKTLWKMKSEVSKKDPKPKPLLETLIPKSSAPLAIPGSPLGISRKQTPASYAAALAPTSKKPVPPSKAARIPVPTAKATSPMRHPLPSRPKTHHRKKAISSRLNRIISKNNGENIQPEVPAQVSP